MAIECDTVLINDTNPVFFLSIQDKHPEVVPEKRCEADTDSDVVTFSNSFIYQPSINSNQLSQHCSLSGVCIATVVTYSGLYWH